MVATPEAVLINTNHVTPYAMNSICILLPSPSKIIKIGSTAVAGIERRNSTIGNTYSRALTNHPSSTPPRIPTIDPRKKPIVIRLILVTTSVTRGDVPVETPVSVSTDGSAAKIVIGVGKKALSHIWVTNCHTANRTRRTTPDQKVRAVFSRA